MKHKFSLGDKVVHDGLIGIVMYQTKSAGTGLPMYGLEADGDPEISCTAMESECEAYVDQDVDQENGLGIARFHGIAIMHQVEAITDKYYRDGNH